jgi:hypothetical protein
MNISDLVFARQLSRTLTTKNLLPTRGISGGTSKAQLQTCKVRTPVRIVYYTRPDLATQWTKAAGYPLGAE